MLVWLVEDDEVDRLAFERAAWPLGVKLRMLPTVRDVLEANPTPRPKVVIIDWVMPGNGKALLEQWTPPAPIVVLTGAPPLPGDLAVIYRAGGACFEKPSQPAKRVAVVESILRYWMLAERRSPVEAAP